MSSPQTGTPIKQVLLAEARPKIVEEIRPLLLAGGYRVQITRDPTRVVAQVSTGAYDVLLLGLSLPNAFEILKEVKTTPATRNVLVVTLLSTPSRPGEVERGNQLGANGFYFAPDRHSLVPYLNRLLLYYAKVRASNLLLIETEATTLRRVRNKLEPLGYTVFVAATQAEALALAASHTIHLILLGTSCAEALPALEPLRALAGLREVPLIVFLSRADEAIPGDRLGRSACSSLVYEEFSDTQLRTEVDVLLGMYPADTTRTQAPSSAPEPPSSATPAASASAPAHSASRGAASARYVRRLADRHRRR